MKLNLTPEGRQPVPYEVAPVAPPSPPVRLASLDQFRGYTVAAMVFVNFVGPLATLHPTFKHHNDYCSYADTIMPQFFLAVGFALRLTFKRRLEVAGGWFAYGRVLRRAVGLILLGVILYHFQHRYFSWAQLVGDFERLGVLGLVWKNVQAQTFQTLVHIGVATLWCLPVMGAGRGWLWVWLFLSGGLHLWVMSQAFWFNPPVTDPANPGVVNWFEFARTRPVIDGGAFGFLTWSIPMLLGAWACDMVRLLPGRRGLVTLAGASVIFMAAGYGMSALDRVAAWWQGALLHWPAPPFIPPWDRPLGLQGPWIEFWTMSQRVGTVSYQTFAAGFALAIFVVFRLIADGARLRLGLFRTLGTNALAAYLIHIAVIDCVQPITPRDAPLWFALAAAALVLGVTWLFTRYLEKMGIYLRL